MDFVERIDEVPRRQPLQKLKELRRQYNTNLPPSLRWGATGRLEEDNAGPISSKRRQLWLDRGDRAPYTIPARNIPPPPPRSDEYPIVPRNIPSPPRDDDVYLERNYRPVYPRIHIDSVLVDSLTWYGLPWKYDKVSIIYIISRTKGHSMLITLVGRCQLHNCSARSVCIRRRCSVCPYKAASGRQRR